jgi:uncharacterized protein
MQCPVCSVDLVMADRLGIEIDYCPKCRGVWLDRGELDKLIERSAGIADQPPMGPRGAMPIAPSYGVQAGRHDDDHEYRDGDHDRYKQQEHGLGRRRRGGWLGDIFGGDD